MYQTYAQIMTTCLIFSSIYNYIVLLLLKEKRLNETLKAVHSFKIT